MREKRLLRGIIDQSTNSDHVSTVGGKDFNVVKKEEEEEADESSDEEFFDADKEPVSFKILKNILTLKSKAKISRQGENKRLEP